MSKLKHYRKRRKLRNYPNWRIFILICDATIANTRAQRTEETRSHGRKVFQVGHFPHFASIGGESWLYSPRETTRMANKGPRARYIMSSRTHKKTRLRNSNDIMFAPLFSQSKGIAGKRERRQEGRKEGRVEKRKRIKLRRRGYGESRREGWRGQRARETARTKGEDTEFSRRHGRLRRNIPSKTFHSTRE